MNRSRFHGIKNGYRSGLEEKVAQELDSSGHIYLYEELKIKWIDHAVRTYTPDFVLENKIIIETKGRFLSSDRRKHLEIKKQYPDLDIRFVFSNSKGKISKNSKTTYADWCVKHGFKYADKSIPKEWIMEEIE